MQIKQSRGRENKWVGHCNKEENLSVVEHQRDWGIVTTDTENEDEMGAGNRGVN